MATPMPQEIKKILFSSKQSVQTGDEEWDKRTHKHKSNEEQTTGGIEEQHWTGEL